MQPMSTTRLANSRTFGLMPGISAITMTAGPVPLRNTSRALPSWVNVVRSYGARSSETAMGQQRSLTVGVAGAERVLAEIVYIYGVD